MSGIECIKSNKIKPNTSLIINKMTERTETKKKKKKKKKNYLNEKNSDQKVKKN